MNKSELLPQFCNLLDPIILEDGYRYLKSHEKYQKKLKGLRLWLLPNITYWASSKYCMVSPRLSVHVDAIEDVLSSHRGLKVDRHFPTLTILSDNLKDPKYWTINNDHDLSHQSNDILNAVKSSYLPLLDSWSSPKEVALSTIKNEQQVFHSELHRLCVLFAYIAAFNDSEAISKVVQSVDFDSISRSRNQQDPYYRGILASMRSEVPEIGEIGIDI